MTESSLRGMLLRVCVALAIAGCEPVLDAGVECGRDTDRCRNDRLPAGCGAGNVYVTASSPTPVERRSALGSARRLRALAIATRSSRRMRLTERTGRRS